MDALGPHRDVDPPASCAAACMRLCVSFKQNVSKIKTKQSVKITLIRYSVQCKYAAVNNKKTTTTTTTTRKIFNTVQTFVARRANIKLKILCLVLLWPGLK